MKQIGKSELEPVPIVKIKYITIDFVIEIDRR